MSISFPGTTIVCSEITILQFNNENINLPNLTVDKTKGQKISHISGEKKDQIDCQHGQV